MMAKSNWQDHFQNQIQALLEEYNKEPLEISLLLFCLRAHALSSQEYLEWAREALELPVLNENFFLTNPPHPDLYKKWQTTFNWGPECLPIAEWDGSVIIACLQKPETYSSTYPTIFVLTSHENLAKTWGTYQSAKEVKEIDFSDMSSLATAISGSEKKENYLGDNGELVLQDDAPSDEEFSEEFNDEKTRVSAEESEGIPDGFLSDDSAPSSGSDLVEFSIESLSLPKASALLPPLEPSSVLVSEDSRPKSIPQPLAPSRPPPSQEISPMMSLMHEEVLRKGPRTTRPVLDTLPSDEEVQEEVSQKKSLNAIAPSPANSLPQAPVKPTHLPGAAAIYLLEKVRKQNQERFDREVIASFNQCKTFFKKSMLLAIGDKDRLVKPIMWDGGFEIRKPSDVEFDLKTPSIFRTVNGTQKPYHGYVVVNDLNETFFEAWNHGQIPDHVTIVPLMDGDLVVGMLMGFGEKSSYNKNVLQFTEGLAKDLSQKIFRSSPNKAA
jgi:hypothetical protein